MFESFKEAWDRILQDPPGKRFRRQYRRRQAAREGIVNRVLIVGLGLVIVTVGIVFLFTPGPGLFCIFLGWGLIAQESLYLAMLLDKIEIYLRKWFEWMLEIWKEVSPVLKTVLVILGLIITLLALYGGYVLFLKP